MATIGKNIELAAAMLAQGKLVGMPTDTVYGLACNALNEEAIRAVYQVKGRSFDKPLIAQTYSLKKASLFLESVPLDAHKLAEAFWPGGLTLILPANNNIPKKMISGGTTVGVRVPDHPMALDLLKSVNFPLAVTSANKSSQPSPVNAMEVNNQIGKDIELILDGGQSQLGIESTIVGFKGEKPVILRSGAISEEAIFEVLKSN